MTSAPIHFGLRRSRENSPTGISRFKPPNPRHTFPSPPPEERAGGEEALVPSLASFMGKRPFNLSLSDWFRGSEAAA